MTGGAPTIDSIFTPKVVIGVGDMAVANNAGVILSTYALGSCLGLVAYEPKLKVGGILHAMLPDSNLSPDKAQKQPSTFVDTGTKLFLQSLQKAGASLGRLTFVLVGGASVMKANSDVFKIGKRNTQAMHAILKSLHIKPVFEDLGGVNNRTLHLHLSTGLVEVKLPSGNKEITLK